MAIQAESFAELLNMYASGNYRFNQSICSYSQKNGGKLGMRSLQRYRNGQTIPSLNDAMEIATIANINISCDEMRALLEHDIIERKKNSRIIKKEVKINYSELDINTAEMDVVKIKRLLEYRIKKGYDNDFSAYVKNLIEKDLEVFMSERKGDTELWQELNSLENN